jgi:hypothetical protein
MGHFRLGDNGDLIGFFVSRNCLILLVAGVGFEPTTFGL